MMEISQINFTLCQVDTQTDDCLTITFPFLFVPKISCCDHNTKHSATFKSLIVLFKSSHDLKVQVLFKNLTQGAIKSETSQILSYARTEEPGYNYNQIEAKGKHAPQCYSSPPSPGPVAHLPLKQTGNEGREKAERGGGEVLNSRLSGI